MKHFLCALAVTVAAVTTPAIAADVGVSVQIGEPGFYGRIDIGNFPQPQVIYPQPVVIQPAPVGVVRQPVYLRVPPKHAKNWRKYCRKYDACGQPVYFVEDRWYKDEYAPRYREGHRGDHGEHHGDDRDRGRDRDHDKGKGHRDD
ncbi:MAG TPA: hypothetical protein VKD04_13300 [Burkholderiales bacterium]|nr:hypothetical protein [Burkholderiales bacterium]